MSTVEGVSTPTEIPDLPIDSWGYRVVRTDYSGWGRLLPFFDYAIFEVYYDSEGEITSYLKDPSAPLGESLEELTGDLTHMLECLTLPVIKAADLPK